MGSSGNWSSWGGSGNYRLKECSGVPVASPPPSPAASLPPAVRVGWASWLHLKARRQHGRFCTDTHQEPFGSEHSRPGCVPLTFIYTLQKSPCPVRCSIWLMLSAKQTFVLWALVHETKIFDLFSLCLPHLDVKKQNGQGRLPFKR